MIERRWLTNEQMLLKGEGKKAGWWKGTILRTNETGYFPASYVKWGSSTWIKIYFISGISTCHEWYHIPLNRDRSEFPLSWAREGDSFLGTFQGRRERFQFWINKIRRASCQRPSTTARMPLWFKKSKKRQSVPALPKSLSKTCGHNHCQINYNTRCCACLESAAPTPAEKKAIQIYHL